MIKECSTCNILKSTDFFHKKKGTKDGLHNQCKECRKAYQQSNRNKINETKRKWGEKNRDKISLYNRTARLKNPSKFQNYRKMALYNITEEQYQEMLKIQENKCRICRTSFTKGTRENKVNVPHIDHCHTTGKVRGLLCSKCNQGLGLFKDNVNFLYEAIKYLQNE